MNTRCHCLRQYLVIAAAWFVACTDATTPKEPSGSTSSSPTDDASTGAAPNATAGDGAVDEGFVDAAPDPSPDASADDAGPKPSLFAPSSPWNVPATGTPDPASKAYVEGDGLGSLAYAFTQAGKGFDIAGTDSYPDYGVPVSMADTTTPKAKVTNSTAWWPGFDAVPIPPTARPATGTDHHLAILDTSTRTLWEFWDMRQGGGGAWSAGAGAKFDADGPGYQTTPGALSARAYGGSLLAGAIRYDEMKAGVIPHALAMAYPWTRGKMYALGLGVDGITSNIACHSDNATEANRNTATNIPEGARLRLKASVDINARCGANVACKTIGDALAKYGMYVVDTAGVPVLFAEVLTATERSWAGVLDIQDARAFQATDFELLSLPAKLTSMP